MALVLRDINHGFDDEVQSSLDAVAFKPAPEPIGAVPSDRPSSPGAVHKAPVVPTLSGRGTFADV